MPELTHKDLLEILDYDPGTGIFVWKKMLSWRAPVGRVAGSVTQHGYVTIKIRGKRFYAHRLAWFYVYRQWPPEQLDHVNHNILDNRVANLELATNLSNGGNQSLAKNNTSGHTGVRFHKPSGMWQARLFRQGKETHLGLFETKEEAAAARKASDPVFSFHPNHGAPEGAC